jgi:hypothetical protein
MFNMMKTTSLRILYFQNMLTELLRDYGKRGI